MTAIATRTTVGLLRLQPEIPRAGLALHALARSAGSVGLACTSTDTYDASASWLVLWGPGRPDREALIRQHVAAGGHAIALDLAYWSRQTKVRLSIDAPHPQAWVMRRPLSRSRWLADPAPVSNQWDPTGPIVIAGLGRKATVQYGAAVETWEAAMRTACHARWPDRRIVSRPKPLVPDPQIDRALTGASLVITWHSNVAVDAIRLGIPVVCRDGAAAAVCPSELPDDPQPLPVDVRDEFLCNLAWFQWSPDESVACWRFLQEVLA